MHSLLFLTHKPKSKIRSWNSSLTDDLAGDCGKNPRRREANPSRMIFCTLMLGSRRASGRRDATLAHQDMQRQANDRLIHQDRSGGGETSPNHNKRSRSAGLRLLLRSAFCGSLKLPCAPVALVKKGKNKLVPMSGWLQGLGKTHQRVCCRMTGELLTFSACPHP